MNVNEHHVRDLSEAVITSITEEEYAQKLRAKGIHIVYHKGRYWREAIPGFYNPIHWLARLTAEQTIALPALSWGFRSALCEDVAASANGSIPVHLLTDVAGYDENFLPKKRRSSLRKCHQMVKFVQLIEPALLQEQGYEVFCSSIERTKHQKPVSRKQYLASLEDFTTDKYRLVLAALIDGKLGGYIDGLAIDGSAYMVNGYYATEALPTKMVTGFTFEFVQICRRSGGIREIADGQHLREIPSLDMLKISMGFPVKYIPAKVYINPIVKPLLRWALPHKYYRLTGQD